MTRNVKSIPEKNIDVEKTIGNVLIASKLKLDDFLYKTGISMDAYRKMVDRGKLSKGAVETILDIFDMNRGYLTGEEEELNYRGELTHGDKSIDNTGKPLGDDFLGTFRRMVEGDTEYVLIPRDVLKDTKLISVDQLAGDRKFMEKIIEQNEKMITRLLAVSEAEHPSVKKGKERA